MFVDLGKLSGSSRPACLSGGSSGSSSDRCSPIAIPEHHLLDKKLQSQIAVQSINIFSKAFQIVELLLTNCA
jgi:hypothetical protein